MTKKVPSKKSVKKTVQKVITEGRDEATVLADRNKYRSSPHYAKARKAGGAA